MRGIGITAAQGSRAELLQSAKAQGLAIQDEQIGTLDSDSGTIVASVIDGFDKLPDTEYAKGVDAAFVYINAPEAGIPAGHYRVHVQADPADIRVGKYKATATLIDKDGKEVAKRATTIESFAVPLKTASAGYRTQLGIQQHTLRDWNLDRFRPTIILIMVRPWGVTVIDLFNTDYRDYYGF